MKKNLSLVILTTATLMLSACTSNDVADGYDGQNVRIVKGDNEDNTITLVMKVADRRAPCAVDNAHQCLLVKTGSHGDWRQFPHVIEGFVYEQGYEYLLEVRKYPDNLEDSNSTGRYLLINQIMKEQAM